MEGVSLVEIEERSHKFGWSLEFEPLGCHDDEHEAVDQLLCEWLSPSFWFFLMSYSFYLTYRLTYSYLVCFFLNPFWQWWSKIMNSCKLFLYFFLVCINSRHIFSCITENRTSLACYRPFFTLDPFYIEA